MHRDLRKQSGDGSDGSPPSEAWLFAQAILGKSIPRIISPEAQAQAQRAELNRLARFSCWHAEELRRVQSAEAEARRERELLEWAAEISTRAADKLRALERKEAEDREDLRRAEQFAETLLEGNWDPSKHPRAPRGQPDGGQWVANGGASSAGSAATSSSPFRTAAFQASQTTAQLAAFSGAQSSTWPTTGPTSSLLPKVGSGAGAAAGAAAGIGAGAFLGGLRNASMGAYWARMPGVQAMPQIWVYELEKRVRAGTLSREDAVNIFNTAVLGAEAQGFKPIGGTMSAVHNSAIGFLGKAEGIYFARKEKAENAPGQAGAAGAKASPERVTGEALTKARREFNGMKSALWKEEAKRNAQRYSSAQLDQMRRGDAPTGSDGEPMEVHHKKPLSEGGANTWENFEFLTHTDHRRKPNFKPNHPNLPQRRSK